MSDFFSQLNSIINPQAEALTQQQQQQQQQQYLLQQQMRQQQMQQQSVSPFDLQQQQRPRSQQFTSPFQHLEQNQQQHSSIINSLSSMPLPSISQLPNALQQQQPQPPISRSPFQNLQQLRHEHQISNVQNSTNVQAILQQQQLNILMQQQQQQQHTVTAAQLQHFHQLQQQQQQQKQQFSINQSSFQQQQQHHSQLQQLPPLPPHIQQPQQLSPIMKQQDDQQRKKHIHSTSANEDIQFPASFNYMPGTASLIEDIDKQLMVILRDGRTLIGFLRSIDQYANLLLSSTIERIHVGTKYGDIPRGIYMIRGENVVLLGEVDFSTPLKVEMTKVSVDEILELQRVEKKKQEEDEKTKKKALLERCLIPHSDGIFEEYY